MTLCEGLLSTVVVILVFGFILPVLYNRYIAVSKDEKELSDRMNALMDKVSDGSMSCEEINKTAAAITDEAKELRR